MLLRNTKTITEQPVFVCIYGASGVGKTSCVKTLDGKALVLNTESGMKVLEGTEIDYISIAEDDKGNFLPYDKRFDRLKEFLEYVQRDAVKAKYKYIFIDSLSECSQLIEKACAAKYEGFKMWGEYKDSMISFLKFFRDMRHYHVVFTALEDRRDEDNVSFYAPMVGGKSVKEQIVSLFDEVYRLVVLEGERVFVCQPTPKTQAKTRNSKIGPTEKATLGDLLSRRTAPIATKEKA